MISVIVRRPEKASILADKGVNAIVVSSGLDDAEALAEAARHHDIVVNAATGFHTDAARSLIRGLGKRKEEQGTDVHFVHVSVNLPFQSWSRQFNFSQLSGTTNLSVQSISRGWAEPVQEFSDRSNSIYCYEQRRKARNTYSQRATDLAVIEEGLRLSIKTYIIMPPLIYGRGTGWFNR